MPLRVCLARTVRRRKRKRRRRKKKRRKGENTAEGETGVMKHCVVPEELSVVSWCIERWAAQGSG